VGKSTFIESFGMMLVEKGIKVAVLAVDPSSTRSGGSIMADKTRMERLAVARGPSSGRRPSGGTLGGSGPDDPGIPAGLRGGRLRCGHRGNGRGGTKSETTVASMVDFFLVLMLAGAGDELQGIKKGVLELADALAVNKADGDNMRKVPKRPARSYELALHLISPATATWTPPVLTCSALERRGLSTIWQTVLDHREKLEAPGNWPPSAATRPCSGCGP
jgi:LAO/AO transport system kinase